MRLLLPAAAISAMTVEGYALRHRREGGNADPSASDGKSKRRNSSGRRLRAELDTFNDDEVQFELMNFDDAIDDDATIISTSSQADVDAVAWVGDPAATRTPTLSPTVTTIPSSSPTATPTSLSPTETSISSLSTAMPTSLTPTETSMSSLSTPTPTTLNPTATPIPSSRLKLYWERGYEWQGHDYDPYYCMECSSSAYCNLGDLIRVELCRDTARDQQFASIGRTIRPAVDPSLCFTIMGYDRGEDTDGVTITTPIELQLCEEDNANQQFVGYHESDKFELSPIERPERCLGQFHHPKSYEKVYPKYCTWGRKDKTNYWITY